MTAVAQTLGVSRSNLAERLSMPRRSRGPYRKQDDLLLQMMRPIIDSRPTYGYRRITALLNCELRAQGLSTVNAKRVLRIMRAHGMTLTAYTAQRPGRTHDGVVVALRSNVSLVLRPSGTALPGRCNCAGSVCHRRLRPRSDRLVGNNWWRLRRNGPQSEWPAWSGASARPKHLGPWNGCPITAVPTLRRTLLKLPLRSACA